MNEVSENHVDRFIARTKGTVIVRIDPVLRPGGVRCLGAKQSVIEIAPGDVEDFTETMARLGHEKKLDMTEAGLL